MPEDGYGKELWESVKKEIMSPLVGERHRENQGRLHGKGCVTAGLERWIRFRHM